VGAVFRARSEEIMTDRELLADLVRYLAVRVREEVESLSPEELAWQPDARGNGIGVTVWHFSRWLDVLAVRVLGGRSAAEEQWQTRGWAAKSGYDPRGIGYLGLGALTGYTWEEVLAIPALSANDLRAYLDQVTGALRDTLLSLPDGALHQPGTDGDAARTAYDRVRAVLTGCFGHVGEIEALKALRARRL
jgi:hypothetical protein